MDDDATGVFENGGNIGCQELSIFAKPNDEWSIATRSNQQIRMFTADDRDGIGASDIL